MLYYLQLSREGTRPLFISRKAGEVGHVVQTMVEQVRTANRKLDGRWPGGRRRRALEQQYTRNVLFGYPPYKDVVIETLGELLWILRQRNWIGGVLRDGAEGAFPAEVMEGKHQLNAQVEWFWEDREEAPPPQEPGTSPLRVPADLREANLSDANLEWANLQDADLREANLRGANLRYANISGCLLTWAKLDGALFISDARADELETAYHRNAEETPYRGIEIRERAELLFVMEARKWFGDPVLEHPAPRDKTRANLRYSRLLLDLQCVDLIGADLEGAELIERTRANDLAAAYKGNSSQIPYEGAPIRTANELLWILREREWSGDPDATTKPRPNLRGVDLREARLNGMYLYGADLRGAQLDGCHLRGARLVGALLTSVQISSSDLRRADLSAVEALGTVFSECAMTGATFDSAKLQGALFQARLAKVQLERASFLFADLTQAILEGADLQHGTLRFAELNGTDLRNADLRGVDARDVKTGARTRLEGALLDTGTWLGGTDWNTGVPLYNVDWKKARRLGDEQLLNRKITPKPTRKQRIATLREVAQAYHRLAAELQKQGVVYPASTYRLREQQLLQRVARLEHRWIVWLFDGVLYIVAGYGERPLRTVGWYVFAQAIFTTLYTLIGRHGGLPFTPVDYLEFSIAAFHGRGFFPDPMGPASIGLDSWITHLAIPEALVGLFIEITFIAAYTKRFINQGGS